MMIELRSVSKSYRRGKFALQDVNLVLRSPGLIGLVGPNGAGKSTLLKLLTANLLPTSGEILVDGHPLLAVENRFKSVLGYLPQEFGLFEDLTVFQFLDYMAALKQIEPEKTKEEIERVVQCTNLTEKRKARIRTLSGGQKQRTGIAQALLGNPQCLIFDEPTVGLDPAERVAFRDLIVKNAEERLVLLSTHIIEDVQSICNRLLVLDQSRLLYDGAPDQLLESQGESTLESAYMSLIRLTVLT